MEIRYVIEENKNRQLAGKLADVHMRSFRDYFSTSFGKGILTDFYNSFMSDNTTIVITAYNDENKAVGFIIGTKNPAAIKKKFFKDNLFRVGFKVLWETIKLNKIIINGISKNIKSRKVSKQSSNSDNYVVYDNSSEENRDKYNVVRLLSICVDPEFGKHGVGSKMMLSYYKAAKDLGFNRTELTVKPENNTAINFYKKNEWVMEYSYETSIGFYRNLD